MEWKGAKRMDGGADGFYQESEAPRGYCITYTKTHDDRAVFAASSDKVTIGHAYVDPGNRELVREMGRAMRAMCGLYYSATTKAKA